jgi:hypothetical protein
MRRGSTRTKGQTKLKSRGEFDDSKNGETAGTGGGWIEDKDMDIA